MLMPGISGRGKTALNRFPIGDNAFYYFAVTVKVTGLLLFMLGATETAKGPEVAPSGIVMVMEMSLQELIVTSTPFSSTTLLPCNAPNPVPVITT